MNAASRGDRSVVLGVVSKLVAVLFAATLSMGAWADLWVATWATANKTENPFGFDANRPAPIANDTTLRQVLRISRGGSEFRIWLTNELGTAPLTIGKVSAARGLEGSAVEDVVPVLFNGSESVTIPPGARVVSDPVSVSAKAFTDLVVSLYVPAHESTQSPVTYHPRALQTNYMDVGDQVMGLDLGAPVEMFVSAYLAAVDVAVRRPLPVIAAIGDSLTDGDQNAATGPEGKPEPIDRNKRYPNFLLKAILRSYASDERIPGLVPVVNLGISGNQVTNDLLGDNAVARFGRDVLSRSGVTHVVVWEGINDIGLPPLLGGVATPAAAIISGLQQIAAQARVAGLKVIGCTLTPSGGFALPTYSSQEADTIRTEVNEWIRTSGAFDAVADLDALMRDPADPTMIKGGPAPSDYTVDGLHFTNRGYRDIAGAIADALLEAGYQ